MSAGLTPASFFFRYSLFYQEILLYFRRITMNKNFSIRFKNYKCFSEYNTIDNIKTVNLLIGKNNCGKTSVLDIVEKVLSNNKANSIIDHSVIDYKTAIAESIYSRVFSRDTYIGFSYNEGNSLYSLGKELLNNECYFRFRIQIPSTHCLKN